MTTQAQWSAASGASACQVGFERASLPVDLDAASGGSGLPTPHDLLDGALAACTTLTLQLYIKRKSWPVQALRVEVAHSKSSSGAYLMTRSIHAEGPLDAEQQAALLRIAEACPVHKTLLGKIEIETRLHNPAG